MKIRKHILFAIIAVMAIIIYPAFVTIGHMSGAENERVVIIGEDGTESIYELCECEHSAFDRERILGKVDGGSSSYYVFKADSELEGGCIYVASSGRGRFYTLISGPPAY